MREIVLDTETTGFDAQGADRIVEIGCVELLNHIPSGREWHVYIDPERDMPQAAYEVHGLSTEFLKGKAVFAGIAEDFLAFIETDRLIIHNASFDIGFLNAELERAGNPLIQLERVLDTLALARRKHPGAQNSLDALCKRYGVNTANRTKHGALIDSHLLAGVYIELIGGQQSALELATSAQAATALDDAAGRAAQRPRSLGARLTSAERKAHETFVRTLGEGALWNKYKSEESAEKD
ncbi:MAG: DNA polymerase III subunit epsilon [Alphaproteobacteria bacterium]